MQLFSRNVVLAGPPAETMAMAADIRAHASQVIGTEIGLWSVMFGAPAGSLAYSLRVDGLAGVAANSAALLGDAGYLSKVGGMAEHMVGPPADTLLDVIHGEPGGTPPPVGAVASVTTAVAAVSFADAVGWGVELAQLAESITGSPVIFGAGMAGTFGEFTWLSVTADAAAADAANAAVTGNADYIAKIGSATDMFVAGAANRVLGTRVA